MAEAQKKTQILVIDDERLIRMTLAAKLRLVDYQAVCVSSTQEAAALLENGGVKNFSAVITDIMMEGMDGFVFRDILRGLDPTMPIFFLTAMDPEEGSGFLKRILEDAGSFYLPKAVKADNLVKRVQGIVASRTIAKTLDEQADASRKAMQLAARVQRSLLPQTSFIGAKSFYTTLWFPKDEVSGDMYEVQTLSDGRQLFILGDVQGHGTGAALSMMAVQSFIKQLSNSGDASKSGPAWIANELQDFISSNFSGVSYMTALICIYDPNSNTVDWISCGAPDLEVVDPNDRTRNNVNPEKRGGLPIGLVDGTEYSESDVVHTRLSPLSVCVAHTDGIFDLSRDADGYDLIPTDLRVRLRNDLFCDARLNGSMVAAPYKFLAACDVYGYGNFSDDVTELLFGLRHKEPGTMVASVEMNPEAINAVAESIGVWCELQGWGVEVSTKLELVFEEKLMNLYDHGLDPGDRARETACVRIRQHGNHAEMTVWDCGTPEPSIEVAAGDADTEFKLKNLEFSGRGRGRLMIREICVGIMRNSYGALNETVYYVDLATGGETQAGTGD